MRTSVAAALRALDDGRHRAEFYRMWRLGVAAGLTHPAILGTMGPFGGTTREVHARLLQGTRAGRDVAELVHGAGALLEPFEAAMLRLGTESGQLDRTLGALGDFFERQHRMMLAVKKQLVAPMFTAACAALIAPLPLLVQGGGTAYLVTAGGGLSGLALLGGGLLAGRAQAYQRRPMFVRARFARALMMGVEAGLPLGRALRLAADASGDPALAAHVARIDERTLVTQSLEASLAGAPTLPSELIASLRVAERTGDLRTTLGRMAELYEDGFR